VVTGITASRLIEKALSPVSASGKPVVFTVKKGTTLKEIIDRLKDQGLIRSRLAFRVLAMIKRAGRRIEAGQFMLSPAQSSSSILKTLMEGKVIRYVVTIPEGYNMYDVGSLLEKAGIVSRAAFLRAARDKSLLSAFNIPGDTAEGFLFPDTYYITGGSSAKEIISQFIRRFWEVWKAEGFDKKAKDAGQSVFQCITLASIVEKEALLPKERPLIAAVFLNRLKRGMRLQADPTVRYGLLVEKGIYPKRLRTRHLKGKTPYNTYLLNGLPKGPISNPGVASIKAVLEPAPVDYLYFVSMNNGTHKFSRTLVEHNRAVYEYQIKKEKGKRNKVGPPKEEVEKASKPVPLSTTKDIKLKNHKTSNN